MKLTDLKSRPSKILVYGPAGSGKTALLLTLGGNAEILDLDDNLEVGLSLTDGLESLRQDCNIRQFHDDNLKKPVAFKQLKTYLYSVADQCRKGTYPYDAIGLDSLTSLATAVQASTMRGLDTAPEIQHWGMILMEIENIISILRSLPIHVFILAHETTFTSDNINKVQISIPGQKLPGRVTRMFSEIWYTRLKSAGQGKQQFLLQTAPTSDITCRSGKGLKTGFVYGEADKAGNAINSTALWDIIHQLEGARKDENVDDTNTTNETNQA